MTLFLGIDGGGTGCRAVVADASGRVLGRAEGGPANINTDVEGAARNILAAARQAASGQDPARICAVLGLAGGSMPGAVARLRPLLPFARAEIVNDGLTAVRGALGHADGVLAAMGTGSVFVLQRGGRVRQVGGRGFLLGDQGSGAVLGRALLERALLAADGLAAMTPLLQAVLDRQGGIAGIIEFANHARPAQFAALSPMLDGPDPAAALILSEALDRVRAIIDTLREGAALPVVLTGGLAPFYAARLADTYPLRAAQGTALDGALAMAIEAGRDLPGRH